MTTPPTTQSGRPRPVCVVTTDDNGTADRVILELARLGTPVLRFDLADFPHHLALDAGLDGNRWTGTLRAGDRTVALEDLGAVWWWHPGLPQVAPGGLPDAEARWATNEATAGLAGVLAALDCLHLNHPAATRTAQNKPAALAQAARSGLHVPATWIGNHPAAARTFSADSPGGVVCKSLTTPTIAHPDRSHSSFHTTAVPPSRLDDSVTLTAHQLQQAITKQYEVRLIAVGTRMFAARIDAHSAAARADFRADYDNLTYQHADIPDPVRTGIITLLGHYRLAYAAIDLLIDNDDRWWLIDFNPAGQYDWLQGELPDLAISAAIARLLTHRDPHDADAPIRRASDRINTSVPHSARIWNYWLGGKDNYPADRAEGDRYAAVFPGITDVARVSRHFLTRSVRYLAEEAGIRQFLDIGTGLPAVDNTHEIAQRVAPHARIVYVDHDPLVLVHARALLTSTPEGTTAYIEADIHDTDTIVNQAANTLDLTQPIALILSGILGHIPDNDEAYALVANLVSALCPGSYLAVNDGTNTHSPAFELAQSGYNNASGAHPYRLRTPEEITAFFHGLDLVEPGIVSCPLWRPETTALGEPKPIDAYGGVGRKNRQTP